MRPVVIGSSGWVREDRPRLVDVPHVVGGFGGPFVKVGVVTLGKAPMCARDLQWRRVPGNAQNGVRIERSTHGHEAILRRA